MRLIPRIIAATFAALTAAVAQDIRAPENVSAVSVLQLAKDEAERATDEVTRTWLRASVAGRIRRTGNEGAFGSYVSDALSANKRSIPRARDGDEIDKFNSEIEQQARQALLSGDFERAEQFMRRCRFEKWPPPSCMPGELPVPLDVFFLLKFLGWETDAGHYDAALHRLKTASWPPELWQMLLVENGLVIAGDDPERRAEIARLLRKSGLEVELCIVKASTYFMYTMFGRKPPTQTGDAAVLRRLACTGQAQAAIESARAESTIERRVAALGVVAEGLAQIPGLPDERLH